MKKILTKEERERWQNILTRFFQQMNETGRCKLPSNIFEMVNDWYNTYLKSEQMKKDIIKEYYNG